MPEQPVYDRDAVTNAFERVLRSDRLGKNSRLPGLLRFLVTEEVEGRGDGLKAYAIGTRVFGRGEDFDPSNDSIVRVEVNRLRQALDHYHATEGRDVPVLITIPKGTYRPVFEQRPVAAAGSASGDEQSRSSRFGANKRWALAGAVGATLATLLLLIGTIGWISDGAPDAEPGLASFDGPRVLVRAYTPLSDDTTTRMLAAGLSGNLVIDLSRYPWLAVMQLNTASSDLADFFVERTGVNAPDFILTGEVGVQGDDLLVMASLMELPGLAVKWSGQFREPFDPGRIDELQTSIANKIAITVGSDQGIVPDLMLSAQSELDEVSFEAFRCVMGMYEYWHDPDEAKHERQRVCIDRAVVDNPTYAEAWASLAFLNIDEAREGRNRRIGVDAWHEAGEAVAEALRLSPHSSVALNAALTYEADRPEPDREAFRRHGERDLKLRPGNPYTLANYGTKLGVVFGDWDEGMALVEQAFRLNPSPPSWYYFGPAYRAVVAHDEEGLRLNANRLAALGSVPAELLRAMAAVWTARYEELPKHLRALEALGVASVADALAYVERRRYEPELMAAMQRGVREVFDVAATGAVTDNGS